MLGPHAISTAVLCLNVKVLTFTSTFQSSFNKHINSFNKQPLLNIGQSKIQDQSIYGIK